MNNPLVFLLPPTKQLFRRLIHSTLLERVGLIAIMILVFNLFFAVEISVTRQPLLNKLLGRPVTNQAVVKATLPAAGNAAAINDTNLAASILPQSGLSLGVSWGDLGQRLVEAGVIDRQKLESLYANNTAALPVITKLLTENNVEPLVISADNSTILLNLLWAFGLGNQNDILTKGEMTDTRYGGAGGFASTGGWTLAKGNAMDHYAKHQFVKLTPEQQDLVSRVSKNIYRPCCGNSTHFPDCNHGMAMLGLLELMASQGADESLMYQSALAANSYWFPDTYLTIAKYLQKQGKLGKVSAQEILGAQYSSATGYQQILSQVEPASSQGGSSCSQ